MGCGQRHAPAAVSPGMAQCLSYRRLVNPRAGLDGHGKSRLHWDSIPGPSENYWKNKGKYRIVRNVFQDLSTRQCGYWFVLGRVGEWELLAAIHIASQRSLSVLLLCHFHVSSLILTFPLFTLIVTHGLRWRLNLVPSQLRQESSVSVKFQPTKCRTTSFCLEKTET